MATTSLRLADMRAEDVAAQLGGKRAGPNDWRIPDLCRGETELRDNPPTNVQNGDKGLIWKCFRCEDQDALQRALQNALGLDSPEPGSRWNARSQPRQERQSAPSEPKKVSQDAEGPKTRGKRRRTILAADFLSRVNGGTCPGCGQPWVVAQNLVHGWPVVECYGCEIDYSTMVKELVNGLDLNVKFTADYQSSVDESILQSTRTEPGKIIGGRGETSKLNPYVLLWSTSTVITGEDVLVVVEGEFAAAAAATYGITAVSWRGGFGQWHLSDWSPVAGARVILWPDNHNSARQKMMELAVHLTDIVGIERMAIVVNDGEDGSDIANMGKTQALQTLETAVPAIDLLVEHQEPEPGTSDEIQWWMKRGGENDLRRVLEFTGLEFAYLWTPDDSDTPQLCVADDVGYWRALTKYGKARLVALISSAREKAVAQARGELSPTAFRQVQKDIGRNVSYMDLRDIDTNLGTMYYKGNVQGLKEFPRDYWVHSRDDGILTLQKQCIELATGNVMPRHRVMDLGLVYDPYWSAVTWRPGAYDEDTLDARNVRTLMVNLGETVNVVAEMLFRMERRIAVVRSEKGGRGKSAMIKLAQGALGSLVGVGNARHIARAAQSKQFPYANNSMCRHRIVFYQEANNVGQGNLDIPALVYLSGESYLATEEKFGSDVARPRMGNPFLTMGEWSDVDWSHQGVFEMDRMTGRLWAYDVGLSGNAGQGADFLPGYVYRSCASVAGQEAFIDLLVQTCMKFEGAPDVHSPDVLKYVQELLLKEDYEPRVAEANIEDHQEHERTRLDVVQEFFMHVDDWETYIELYGLAQKVDIRMEEAGFAPIPGNDRDWANALRTVFKLPARHENAPRLVGSDGKSEYPIRYVRWA